MYILVYVYIIYMYSMYIYIYLYIRYARHKGFGEACCGSGRIKDPDPGSVPGCLGSGSISYPMSTKN
jgi:hypothetical protein